MLLAAAGVTFMIRARFDGGGYGSVRVDRAAAMEGMHWDKTEFAAAVTRVKTCPVCFGQDFCQELARYEDALIRSIMCGGITCIIFFQIRTRYFNCLAQPGSTPSTSLPGNQ